MSKKADPPREGYVFVELVSGREGPCLVIGNHESGERVAGPKPWGGGTTAHRFQVRAEDLIRLAKEYGGKK